MHLLYKFLGNLANPLNLLFFWIALGLILPSWQRVGRKGALRASDPLACSFYASIRALSLACLIFLYLFSLPVVCRVLAKGLESAYPALGEISELRPEEYDVYGAIVVLGGGSLQASPSEAGRAEPSAEGTRRLVYGLRLARALGLPLVLSGGRVYGEAESEADSAKRLALELGYPPSTIIAESSSRDTWENARLSLKAMREAGVGGDPIVVSSAYHMPRVMLSFRRQGIGALAAPCAYLSDGPRSGGLGSAYLDLMPSAQRLSDSLRLVREYMGLVVYSIRH